jgi:hypothetical protein
MVRSEAARARMAVVAGRNIRLRFCTGSSEGQGLDSAEDARFVGTDLIGRARTGVGKELADRFRG